MRDNDLTGPEYHSYRSASNGLTEAAFRDGKKVKTKSMVMAAAAKEKAAVPRFKDEGQSDRAAYEARRRTRHSDT
jgi:hypothetical protein